MKLARGEASSTKAGSPHDEKDQNVSMFTTPQKPERAYPNLSKRSEPCEIVSISKKGERCVLFSSWRHEYADMFWEREVRRNKLKTMMICS